MDRVNQVRDTVDYIAKVVIQSSEEESDPCEKLAELIYDRYFADRRSPAELALTISWLMDHLYLNMSSTMASSEHKPN